MRLSLIHIFILTLGESDPFFNLSAEEYFLCEKDEDFFLLWQNEPCIVIGRNQNAADEINGDYVRTRSLPVVRRMTGGGAVYHDAGNLNFSFIINGEADRVELCRPVIDAVSYTHLDVYKRQALHPQPEPPACTACVLRS